MPVTGDVNQEKDFMIIKIRNMMQWQRLLLLVCLTACTNEMSDDPIPFQAFPDKVIDLTLPEYVNLNTDKGFKYIDDLGVRGILLYRHSSNNYIAYERNCSYHPNDACATINVHSSNLYMIDPCCNSTFTFPEGEPDDGPAWRPLQQYRTSLSGSTLTITDDVIE